MLINETIKKSFLQDAPTIDDKVNTDSSVVVPDNVINSFDDDGISTVGFFDHDSTNLFGTMNQK